MREKMRPEDIRSSSSSWKRLQILLNACTFIGKYKFQETASLRIAAEDAAEWTPPKNIYWAINHRLVPTTAQIDACPHAVRAEQKLEL